MNNMKKVTFNKLHNFATNPFNNMDIVQDMYRKSCNVLSVTFTDGMNVNLGLPRYKVKKLMDLFNIITKIKTK